MNFILRKITLLLALSVIVYSCQKDNFDITEVKPDEIKIEINYINDLTDRMSEGAGGDGIKLGCLVLQMPFEIIDKEEQTHTINEAADLRTLRRAEVEIVDFVYPLIATFEDGEEKEINNAAELGFAFASCLPDGGWERDRFPAYAINFDNSCFALKYPISVMKLDSSNVELENEAMFSALLAAEEKVFFNFPLTLLDDERAEYTVNSVEELFDLLLECREDRDRDDWRYGIDKVGCYSLVFPVNIILKDGSTFEVMNKAMFSRILLADKMKAFAFPLNLMDKDENEFTVHSKEELRTAIEDCKEEEEEEHKIWEVLVLYKGAMGDEPCYRINFPIEILLYDENRNERRVVIENMQDYDRLLSNLGERTAYATFDYPVEITWKDGTIISIAGKEMLERIMKRCDGLWDDDHDEEEEEDSERIWQLLALYKGAAGDEPCYQINFPIEVLLYDENENERRVVVEDMEGYARLLRRVEEGETHAKLHYPVEITWKDGSIVHVENENILKRIMERCESMQDGGEDDEDRENAYELKLLIRGAAGEMPCYEINFPLGITVINERREERSIELENMEGFGRLMRNLDEDKFYKLVFPIQLTLSESQETIEVEDIAGLKRILERC